MASKTQKIPSIQNFYHDIKSFRFSNIIFSVTLLFLDAVVALLMIIILTWRFNINHSEFFIATLLSKAQLFLESFLFRADLSPLVVFLFLGTVIVYGALRIKRNIQRLLTPHHQHLTYLPVGLSLFLLLILPFIIVPNIFYPHVSLQETSSNLKVTSNLQATNNPLRRTGRFFRAFSGGGCSYEDISWSETADKLYFSTNKNCDQEYFFYDATTQILTQKAAPPDNSSLSVPADETLRFPDFIGSNYTIKNFPSPSGKWTALLVSYMNFDTLQDIMLVRSEDVKLLE